MPPLSCDLRNAAAHGAGADDANDKIASIRIEGHG